MMLGFTLFSAIGRLHNSLVTVNYPLYLGLFISSFPSSDVRMVLPWILPANEG